MAVNRWSLGVLVGIVALLGFVGFSPAQKTTATETMVWDTAVLDTGTNSFNEERLRLLSDGWEPFATSDEGSGIYRLHFRKRVPLAIIQKQVNDLKSQRTAEKSA